MAQMVQAGGELHLLAVLLQLPCGGEVSWTTGCQVRALLAH